ncbi:MAG: aminotransferase class V-fold PLP-dependent enzyme [Acidobacteriaceae bacterium]
MSIESAVSALGDDALGEEEIAQHIAPLFSRVLAPGRIYLANHSLGRPLDRMADDVAEAAALWYGKLADAWNDWLAEREAFRKRIAQLIGAERPDCIVPRTSAGQGLRAVLNALPGKPRVVSTRGEFDAVDLILKQYAALGRIEVRWVEPDAQSEFSASALMREVERGSDLVVVSLAMFMTGQLVGWLDRLAEACHAQGTRLLVDLYHAVGVVPVDVHAMGADFAIGGSYKYLRGGPGAGYLYLSPEVMDRGGLRPLDTGWFANEDMFRFQRPEPPALKAGGDAFLEGTPAVLTWYQARSGAEFALAMGVARLREYSLGQLRALRSYLAEAGVEQQVTGGDERHGAFLSIRLKHAMAVPEKMQQRGVTCDARGEWLRLCPDCLTRDGELRRAARALGDVLAETPA